MIFPLWGDSPDDRNRSAGVRAARHHRAPRSGRSEAESLDAGAQNGGSRGSADSSGVRFCFCFCFCFCCCRCFCALLFKRGGLCGPRATREREAEGGGPTASAQADAGSEATRGPEPMRVAKASSGAERSDSEQRSDAPAHGGSGWPRGAQRRSRQASEASAAGQGPRGQAQGGRSEATNPQLVSFTTSEARSALLRGHAPAR